MKIDSGIANAVLGMQRGLQDMQRHAAQIASAKQADGGSNSDLATAMVGLMQDQNQVQASAKVVSTIDSTIGSLFDQKA